MSNKVRLDFDRETQKWMLFTPVALNAQQLDKVVTYTKNQYIRRLHGEIGDRRKRMEEAIAKLKYNTIEQHLIGAGDKTIYFDGKY